jgi:CheY-like chemotaxis protein
LRSGICVLMCMRETILVVERDLAERKLLTALLSKKFILYFTPTVDECIQKLRYAHPGLIVLGLPQPDIDALNKLSFFLKVSSREIPLIVGVAENDLDFERAARELRIFYYLVKPYDQVELVRAIGSAMALIHEEAVRK